MVGPRRRFLALSGLALVAGCGGKSDEPEPDADTRLGSAAQSDIELLNAALDLEHRAVAAYAHVAPLLSGDARSAASSFADHERAHAKELADAVRDLGGAPNPAKGDYGFPELADEVAALGFAVDLEDTAMAFYIDTLPKLSSAELRATAASIMTTEAEHASVLLGALDLPQVRDAFVVGRKV